MIHDQPLIDLHTHTTASDGIYSPIDLVEHAIEVGCRILAIADHDTVGGLDEALAYASGKNIVLIPAIEFSIDYERGSFHLLGMNINHKDDMLHEVFDDLQERRSIRVTRIVDDLKRHGVVIREEEIIAESGGESIGRPHVARVLVRHGYARSTEEVFKKFLVPGKPGYVKKEKINLEQAISIIHHAKGKAIVAHPVSLNINSFREFEEEILRFRSLGVEGIEAYASMHDESHVKRFVGLASKHSLIISGGSDFHGDKHERLGYYGTIHPIPWQIWEPLSRILGLG